MRSERAACRQVCDADSHICRADAAEEAFDRCKPRTQSRNFTHGKDIVSGLKIVGRDGAGDGHGIGNAKSYSVMDVAKIFGGEIEMLPERRGNRLDAELVASKIQRLGWEPTVPLEGCVGELRDRGWQHFESN